MLLELMPENYVWINEDEAKELGIKHGDEVELKSSVGAIKIKAYPTAKIIPQTLFFVHGFGAKSTGLTFAHRNGASDNEIIEDNIEPTFGCANMHNTLVTIRKGVIMNYAMALDYQNCINCKACETACKERKWCAAWGT